MTRDELYLAVIHSNEHLRSYGWCSLAKAMKIIEVMDLVKPKLSVELGVFGGRSLLPMAIWHNEYGGKVIGIDPWSNDIATKGYDKVNADWWRGVNMSNVQQACRSVLQKFDHKNVTTLRVDTSDNSPLPEEPIGLLHIDGQHTQQATMDVRKWAPQVKGCIIMDDLNWMNEGEDHVQQAANLLQELGFRKGDNIDTGAVFFNV